MSATEQQSPQDMIAALKTRDFLYAVNVASDVRTVKRILRANDNVIGLTKRFAEPHVADLVLTELKRLVELKIDEECESPWDVTLSALLLVIWDGQYDSAPLAAALALKAPNTWWARSIASEIAASRHAKSTKSFVVFRDALTKAIEAWPDKKEGDTK